MPRVVIVNDASLARGGATGLSLLQARLLSDRGVDCVFVAGDAGDVGEAKILRQAGVRIRAAGGTSLMAKPRLKAAVEGLYNYRVYDLLREIIAEEDGPDTVYHVHSWSKTLTASAFAALRPVASRVFIHAHDYFLACPNGGFMDYQAMEPCNRRPLSAACLITNCDKRSRAQKAWRVSRQLILRRTLPRTAPWAGIFMIHPDMAPAFVRSGYPIERLITLRNPATATVDHRIRAENNTGILFVGRVEAEKGVPELVAAAQRTGVTLTIVGEGPLRETLAAQHPNIRFTGWANRARIGEEMSRVRALAMPSLYPEPFGLVAAEASLSGLPVIASDTALLGAEILKKGIGITCRATDPASLDRAICYIAEAPNTEIATMSQRAASGRAQLSSTPHGWIDAQLEVYDEALSAA